MNIRKQLVRDCDGMTTVADVATCPECNGDTFHIMIVQGHNHLLCCNCFVSFCQSGDECGKTEVVENNS